MIINKPIEALTMEESEVARSSRSASGSNYYESGYWCVPTLPRMSNSLIYDEVSAHTTMSNVSPSSNRYEQ